MFSFASCGTTIAQQIKATNVKSTEWELFIKKVTVGPSSVKMGAGNTHNSIMYYQPKDLRKDTLVWVDLEVTNKSSVDKKFDLRQVKLVHQGKELTVGVYRYPYWAVKMDIITGPVHLVSAGKKIKRTLIYIFPLNARPEKVVAHDIAELNIPEEIKK